MTVTSGSTGLIEVRWIASSFAWAELGYAAEALGATEAASSGGRIIYINGARSWIAGCTGGYGEYDYQTILVHELGHALGLKHYEQGWEELLGCGTEDGPESCTVMTHCQGVGCEREPLSLDELAISCMYGIGPGGRTTWGRVKSLFSQCYRTVNADFRALCGASTTLYWNPALTEGASLAVFRSAVGEDPELIGYAEPGDSVYVDDAELPASRYEYVLACLDADSLVDFGAGQTGLSTVTEIELQDIDLDGSIGAARQHGSAIFALNGERIVKFDVTVSANPLLVAEQDPSGCGFLKHIALNDDGSLVFATDGTKVVIATSSDLSIVGYWSTTENHPINDLDAHGNVALIAFEMGLAALPVDPVTHQMSSCAYYSWGHQVFALDRVQSLVYLRKVVNGAHVSEILSVAHQAGGVCAFTVECSSNMPCWPSGVRLAPIQECVPSATHALASTNTGNLAILNCSDPVHPVILKTITPVIDSSPFPVHSCTFDESYAFLATNVSGNLFGLGLFAYSLSSPDADPELWGGEHRGVSFGSGQVLSHGRYLYHFDRLDGNPWWPGSMSRMRVFKKGYLNAGLTTSKRLSGGTVVTGVGDAIAFCPQGDAEQLIISVELDPSYIEEGDLPQGSLTARWIGSPSLIGHNATTVADSILTLSGNTYRTTITVRKVSGCGVDSLAVELNGTILGYVSVAGTSLDSNLLQPSYGNVNIQDIAEFASHYGSTVCECASNKPYDACFDYVPSDTTINAQDFALIGGHYGHSTGGAPLVDPQPTSPVTLGLTLETDEPLVGKQVLRARISMRSTSAFIAAVFGLKSDQPEYRFSNWHQGDSGLHIAAGRIDNDASDEVMLVVLGSKHQTGTEYDLGYFEFEIQPGADPLSGSDVLSVITADVLDVHQSVSSVSQINRTVLPPNYTNGLAQNYPNPFNPTTSIPFSLAKKGRVSLKVFDVRGALVRDLFQGELPSGVHRLRWDGLNNSHQASASGVYFYKLTTHGFTASRKMLLLR